MSKALLKKVQIHTLRFLPLLLGPFQRSLPVIKKIITTIKEVITRPSALGMVVIVIVIIIIMASK